MRYQTTTIEHGERFRAALAHLALPIVLFTGAQYQNEWWLYALPIVIPLFLKSFGAGPVIDPTYPVPFVAHHARRAVGFALTMGIVAIGLAFVLVGFLNSESHQEQVIQGIIQRDDSIFWFVNLMLQYHKIALHPLFPAAHMVLIVALVVGVVCPLRSAWSALRGDLRTF